VNTEHSAVRHSDLLGERPLCCIDGRCETPVVGSPGGTLGELIVVLTAIEDLAGPLSEHAIESALGRAAGKVGVFYHHTDEERLRRLAMCIADKGHSVPSQSAQFAAWINDPPESCRESLLDMAVRPDNVGCGHIALLLREPENYGVRRPLVEGAIRAFYRSLWRGEHELLLGILSGRHCEQQIVFAPSDGGAHPEATCAAVTPGGEPSALVVHPDAARWLRAQMLWAAWDSRPMSGASSELPLSGRRRAARTSQAATGDMTTGMLVSAANELAQHHLETTLERLAPGMERLQLEPGRRAATTSAITTASNTNRDEAGR